MRLILHLGTRGGPGALASALDGHHDPVQILVPADPRLLGPTLSQADLGDGLADVARIVLDHALDHARRLARDEARELSQVFDREPPDPRQRVTGRVLEGPVEDALATVLVEGEAGELYVARDALDILDDVGIRPADALEPQGVDLVAR